MRVSEKKLWKRCPIIAQKHDKYMQLPESLNQANRNFEEEKGTFAITHISLLNISFIVYF